MRFPSFAMRRIASQQEPTEPDPAWPASDVPPILDESDQKVVDKLDRIIDVAETALNESRRARGELPRIQRTLDLIIQRMEQAPNPILGPMPTAPLGTRTKRQAP